MKKLYLLILLFISLVSTAQFSKTHYIPPLSGSDNASSSAEDQYLYISTPSITPVNFTIKQLGSTNVTGTVSKGTPYVYTIGNGTNTQLMTAKSQVNSVRSDKGFIIEAGASGVGGFGYFPESGELFDSIIGPGLDKVWAGEVSAEEGAAEVCKQVDAFLAENGYPKQ